MTKEQTIKHLENNVKDLKDSVAAIEKSINLLSNLKFFPIGIKKGTNLLYHLNLRIMQEFYNGPFKVYITAVKLEYNSMERSPYSIAEDIQLDELYEKFIPYTEKTNAIIGDNF